MANGILGHMTETFIQEEATYGAADGTWETFTLKPRPGARPRKTRPPIEVQQLSGYRSPRRPLPGKVIIAPADFTFDLMARNMLLILKHAMGSVVDQNDAKTAAVMSATSVAASITAGITDPDTSGIAPAIIDMTFSIAQTDPTVRVLGTDQNNHPIEEDATHSGLLSQGSSLRTTKYFKTVTEFQCGASVITTGGTIAATADRVTESFNLALLQPSQGSLAIQQYLGGSIRKNFTGIKINTLGINVAGNDSPVEATIGILAKDEVDEPSSAGVTEEGFADIFPGWDTTFNLKVLPSGINAAIQPTAFSFTLANNYIYPPQINGSEFQGEPVFDGVRTINGSFTIPFNKTTSPTADGTEGQFILSQFFAHNPCQLTIRINSRPWAWAYQYLEFVFPEIYFTGEGNPDDIPQGQTFQTMTFGAAPPLDGPGTTATAEGEMTGVARTLDQTAP